MRIYQEYLGVINQIIAYIADRVTKVLYGIFINCERNVIKIF